MSESGQKNEGVVAEVRITLSREHKVSIVQNGDVDSLWQLLAQVLERCQQISQNS